MNCACPIEPGMTYQELFDICAAGKQCCDDRVNPGKGWICPNMDKALREADVVRQRHERQARKMKGEGRTKSEIASTPIRTRRRGGIAAKRAPQLNFDV